MPDAQARPKNPPPPVREHVAREPTGGHSAGALRARHYALLLLLLERAVSVKSCCLWIFVGQGDGKSRLMGDEEMGDRPALPCLTRCKEQRLIFPQGFQNAFAECRSPGAGGRSFVRCAFVRVFVRSAAWLCAQNRPDGWADLLAWPGLDGPCRDDANGFTATAALW